MFAVDPRRTSSAKFADAWLGLNVGTDVAMANAIGREIITADLHNKDFIAHSSQGFEDYKAHVEPYTLEYAEAITGVPGQASRNRSTMAFAGAMHHRSNPLSGSDPAQVSKSWTTSAPARTWAIR